jgi:hypothetical protein
MTQSGGAIGDYSTVGLAPKQGPKNCRCGHSLSRYHANGVCFYLTPELACGGPCGPKDADA